MKIVITGGHLSPALAVIDVLPKDTEILFIGRKYTLEGDKTESLEYRTIKGKGIRFKAITTGRLQRKFTRYTLMSLIKIPYGFSQALGILSDFKPDIVLTFGGYLSLPVAFAAKVLNIPLIIHEQTLGAGLANKIIGKFANKVCISWQESRKFFPRDKIVLTGNPLKKELIDRIPLAPFNKGGNDTDLNKGGSSKITPFTKGGLRGIKTIYITGGSAGSHAINELIKGCIEKLLDHYVIIHQTGDAAEYKDYEILQNIHEHLTKEKKERYFLLKFVDPADVIKFYSQADLVISRSGMNTVSELMYLGKPSLFIPLPHGQNYEQLNNALFAQNLGFAKVALQKELSPEKLYDLVTLMIENINEYNVDGETAKKKIIKDAAYKIVEVIQNVKKKEN